MMEMIRSWRILPLAAWPRAMMDMALAGFRAIKSRKVRSFTIWSIAIILLGMLIGAMTVIFPPMASIGVVAVVGVVLLWAMPDLHIVPERLLRKMFFAMVFVQLCVPAYFAIDTRILPWISVRRFFSLAVILLFALTVASSQSARQKISETLRTNRVLASCVIGFLLMIFVSIFTSPYISAAVSGFSDALLNWYVPFFACILIVRSEEDVMFIAKTIAVSGIVVAALGIVEFFLQRRYYFDIFPQGVLQDMMASNPALAAMINISMFRNGLYRAASIFSVSLSLSEFMAMVAPIAAFFVLHGSTFKLRTLGVLATIFALLGIFISGARGGYIAFLVAMPLMMFLWVLRYRKLHPASLTPAIMFALFFVGTVAVAGVVMSSTRVHNYVLGGGDTAASTEARFRQWNLAEPHVLRNPITGHGLGSSGDLIGYMADSGIPTVDSTIITLLVEQGVPGLLLFFGMIIVGIWTCLRIYLSDMDAKAALAGPLACTLLAFGVYRTALSQRESHTLLFLIIGLVFAVAKLAHDRRVAVRKNLRNHPQQARYAAVSLPEPWARSRQS